MGRRFEAGVAAKTDTEVSSASSFIGIRPGQRDDDVGAPGAGPALIPFSGATDVLSTPFYDQAVKSGGLPPEPQSLMMAEQVCRQTG